MYAHPRRNQYFCKERYLPLVEKLCNQAKSGFDGSGVRSEFNARVVGKPEANRRKLKNRIV